MQKLFIFSLITVLFFPLVVFAGVGVGVGTGKINIDQPLKPGGIYDLPSFSVLNTGDEPGDYEVEVTYHSQQTQLKPSQEWFSFSPQSFFLEPKESQVVAVKLSLPVKATPGDYLGYLEAHPVIKGGEGTTRVGIAAATKLYFTVVPANFWQAIIFRISSFWALYSPWTWIVLVVIVVGIVLVFFKKHFAFQIGVKKK